MRTSYDWEPCEWGRCNNGRWHLVNRGLQEPDDFIHPLERCTGEQDDEA